MHREEFEKNWNQLKGKIHDKWNKFSMDEISKMTGKYDQFMSQLQKKYGYAREQAEMSMKEWLHKECSQKPSKDGCCGNHSCKDLHHHDKKRKAS